jgi:hypothetical protein
MESDSDSDYDDEDGIYDLSPDEDELILEDDDEDSEDEEDSEEDELDDLAGRVEEITYNPSNSFD